MGEWLQLERISLEEWTFLEECLMPFFSATVYSAQFSIGISSSNHLVRQMVMCCWVEGLVILFFLHPLVQKQKGISWFPRSVAADANSTSLVSRANADHVLSLSLSFTCIEESTIWHKMFRTSSVWYAIIYFYTAFLPCISIIFQYFTDSGVMCVWKAESYKFYVNWQYNIWI